MKELRVGLIGYGFIGRMHTLAYRSIPIYYDPIPCRTRLVGVCCTSEQSCRRAVGQAGYEFATTNWRELVQRDDIDIIDCCAPNYLHKEVIIESIKRGKHVYCEKPLARDLGEAQQILKETRNCRAKAQITLMYRFIPAMMRARQLIEDGFLGRPFSFRAAYLHSGYIDPNRPLTWRLDRKKAGGGALFDIGSHVIDLIRFLLGEFEGVFATSETFIRERPLPDRPDERARVEVDDLTLLLVRMENGALGTLEASRVATGTNDELRIEVHGSQGAIRFNLMNPNWLEVYDNREAGEPIGGNRGFKRIETVQRYPKPAVFPGPKFAIGWVRYHIASLHSFLVNIVEDRPCSPSLEDGVRVQEVMEAAYISAEHGGWVSLPLK
ncbi:MAG TPA: Gfo/Idh/MocA family oxidoreductase [Candidatus Latescibacteria bacterium]|nr:Gfo/Idh/MocA family oxidoreductase [Candidatus Latescibacterota bacterium]